MEDEYSITAKFEKGQPVNWALIGGIVGAAVIAGLVIFFVRRKKGVQKEGREKKATRAKRR
jgi:LPXTG-motif cell wall-anchored protein